LLPAAAKLIEQLPAATVVVHVSPASSLIVTLPVGVPLPGESGTTVNWKVTGWPTTVELAETWVMVVLVLASFTVCEVPIDVLGL
jgi:hypothetical protein